ncbi:MAG: FkbM family methyltransferase [Vulcanisaeta sp.]
MEVSGDVDSTGVMYHKLGNKHSNCVSAITLNEVIHEFSINPSNAVLKMDCEGCEYDVILNDYNHVRLFNEVYFEYHPYQVGVPVSRLLMLLREDYTCNAVSTENFYTRHGMDKEQLGIIHCKRKA